MRALLNQIKWQFVILNKNKLIAISFAVTALYGLIFFLIKDMPNVEPFLTLLIYNDPAIIGLFFIGLSIIMENNDNLLPALFVTPVNRHVYLISRVLSLSLIGLACAAGMALTILGPYINWLEFSIGVFSTCLIFSLVGIFVVSYTMDFLSFMLRSIPLMILLSLPLLNYFGLTDNFYFELTPTQGPLNLTISSFGTQAPSTANWISYLSILIWIPILYLFVYKIFTARVAKSM
jgi:fluoroquinolone transport system permease protein